MKKNIHIFLGIVTLALLIACAPKVEEKVQLEDETGNIIGEAVMSKAGSYKIDTKKIGAINPIKQWGLTLRPGSFETLADGSIKVARKPLLGARYKQPEPDCQTAPCPEPSPVSGFSLQLGIKPLDKSQLAQIPGGKIGKAGECLEWCCEEDCNEDGCIAYCECCG